MAWGPEADQCRKSLILHEREGSQECAVSQTGIVAGLARRFTALVHACGVKGRQGSDVPTEPAAELGSPHGLLKTAR